MRKEINVNVLAEIFKQHFKLTKTPVIVSAYVGSIFGKEKPRSYEIGVASILTITIEFDEEEKK